MLLTRCPGRYPRLVDIIHEARGQRPSMNSAFVASQTVEAVTERYDPCNSKHSHCKEDIDEQVATAPSDECRGSRGE